jgi:hypothetical protein
MAISLMKDKKEIATEARKARKKTEQDYPEGIPLEMKDEWSTETSSG